jgi:universal stress protein E
MQILAATEFSTRSQRALRRAGQLAQAETAELAIIHVVDDDQPQRLVEMEVRESERMLRELTSAVSELRDVRCHPMVVKGDPFDAIVRTAAAQTADLLVMGAHRKQLLRDIFVGTTIERVIRTGRHPVLMVNNEVNAPYEVVLTPVDFHSRRCGKISARCDCREIRCRHQDEVERTGNRHRREGDGFPNDGAAWRNF